MLTVVVMRALWLLGMVLGSSLTLVAGCGAGDEDVTPVAGAGGNGFPNLGGGAGLAVGGAAGWVASGGVAGLAGAGGQAGIPSECPRVKVVVLPDEVLNVRPEPNTNQAPVGTLANGAIVDVLAIVQGQNIDGNTTWYQIQTTQLSGYVSGMFAACTTEEPPAPPKGYYLPLQCGTTAKVTQGPNGDVSHQGAQFYAYDFAVPLNTPVVAMAAGTVSFVSINSKPGDACYNGGGSSCAPYANRLSIQHADGKSTYYTHLNEVKVAVGQVVTQGQLVGLSGTTGWSTGPHLHAQKQESCGSVSCTTIPITFVEAGQPAVGTVVTSANCP